MKLSWLTPEIDSEISGRREIMAKRIKKTSYVRCRGGSPLLEGIDRKLLGREDAALLNRYHRQVRTALSPLLNERERVFLAEATREIIV